MQKTDENGNIQIIKNSFNKKKVERKQTTNNGSKKKKCCNKIGRKKK